MKESLFISFDSHKKPLNLCKLVNDFYWQIRVPFPTGASKIKKTWSTDIKSNFLLVNVSSNLLLGVLHLQSIVFRL